MEDISDIRSILLSSLTITTKRVLSDLLNSTKVLPTKGDVRRHRDWRGLASLIHINSEVAYDLSHYDDKMERVLQIWMQNRRASVGELLDHLSTLDRFDVYDDVIISIREQNQRMPENQVAIHNNNIVYNQVLELDDEPITFEDRPGHKHIYDAYALHAEEDKPFLLEMKSFLSRYGIEICTKDNLLPGYASQFPPVAQLISERCRRIILIFSEDFLRSNDNSFFRDYAQAYSIEVNRTLLLPIIYRPCELPRHLRLYCSLYYNSDIFWDRLLRSLENSRSARLAAPPAPASSPLQNSSSHSAVNIVTASDATDDSRYFLPNTNRINSLTPSNVSLAPSTVSLPEMTSQNVNSQTILTDPVKKKKKGMITRIFRRKKTTVPCA